MKHQKLSTTPEISKRMANVHLKASKAETDLAKELWRRGLRYRKNYRKLPGSPDIAILKHKIAVFVDGEFWHGKDWDQKKECLKCGVVILPTFSLILILGTHREVAGS